MSDKLATMMSEVDSNSAILDNMLSACNGKSACEEEAIETAIQHELSQANPQQLQKCLETKLVETNMKNLLSKEIEQNTALLNRMKTALANTLAGAEQKAEDPQEVVSQAAKADEEALEGPKLIIANMTNADEFMTVPKCEEQVATLKAGNLKLQEQRASAAAKMVDAKAKAVQAATSPSK